MTQTVPATVPVTKTRRPRDMALSLVVLLIPVFLVVMAYRFVYGGDQVVVVDPATATASAQRAGVPAFTAAPQEWQIVSAQFSEGVLRVGYLTPQDKGVQLIQTKQQLPKDKIAKDGETVLSGKSGDMWVFIVGKDADLEPLTRSLPVTLTPMP